MSARRLFPLAALLALAACATPASDPKPSPAFTPQAWAAACEGRDGWDEPGPPFHIHANTYYVGTCGISAILIVSPDGHTLVDSGTEAGAEIVLANIRALGFDPKDVANLLMSHEHFDHVGGMARLQAATGARLVVSPAAAEVMRTGRSASDDPQAGMHPPFAPVGELHVIEEGIDILSGDVVFKPIVTPGHTPGAMSWQWVSCAEGDMCRHIVYADSLNPISSDAYRFSDHPAYLSAFRAGLDRLAALDCAILLTPHPAASGMRERALAGDFNDPQACRDYAARVRARLEARLAKEADG